MRLFVLFEKTYYNILDRILIPPLIWIILKLNKIEVKRHAQFRGIPFIRNFGTFVIKENVIVISSYRNNPIGGQTFSSFWVKPGGFLQINENSKISNISIVCQESIIIGKNVFIGGNCAIYDTDFHSLNSHNRTTLNDSDAKTKPVIINDSVFIGSSCIILKGVEIGRNAIVGAGSVVTKNIPENQTWAGNPAKFIRVNTSS